MVERAGCKLAIEALKCKWKCWWNGERMDAFVMLIKFVIRVLFIIVQVWGNLRVFFGKDRGALRSFGIFLIFWCFLECTNENLKPRSDTGRRRSRQN
jgi:hypothetical protein